MEKPFKNYSCMFTLMVPMETKARDEEQAKEHFRNLKTSDVIFEADRLIGFSYIDFELGILKCLDEGDK